MWYKQKSSSEECRTMKSGGIWPSFGGEISIDNLWVSCSPWVTGGCLCCSQLFRGGPSSATPCQRNGAVPSKGPKAPSNSFLSLSPELWSSGILTPDCSVRKVTASMKTCLNPQPLHKKLRCGGISLTPAPSPGEAELGRSLQQSV